jgi:hypothetical protein
MIREPLARMLTRAAVLLVRLVALAALALPPLAAVVYLTRWLTM